MKGSQAIIDALNSVLTKELTAINQYFLHARMLQNWGLEKLGRLEYAASIDEMKHADELIKRILFLEGLPNLQKIDRIKIGQNVKEVIEADLEVENAAVPHLKNCIRLAEQESDYVSRDLFLKILASEEEHVDWLETQLSLLNDLVDNYKIIFSPDDDSVSVGRPKLTKNFENKYFMLFEVENPKKDFVNWFRQKGLEQKLLIRPLGNSVYIMPPYIIIEEEMQWII